MFKKSLICLSFLFLLTTVFTYSQEIDLLEKAPEAKWANTENQALRFGADQGESGMVKYEYDYVLEDGTTYKRVLFTHPQWKRYGTVYGTFENITIPENDPKLIIAGGFGQGAAGTDGVKFYVSVAGMGEETTQTRVRVRRTDRPTTTIKTLCSFDARYDNKIDTLECDLKEYAGQTGNIILVVEAGNTSEKDWAVWTEAKIISGEEVKEEVKAKAEKPKKVVANLRGHGSRIYCVDVSPNGKHLVTASGDRTAKIWSFPSGKMVTSLSGHSAHVFTAAFSNNSRRVVTASGDQTARIWQAASGSQLQELRGHTAQVLSAAFSPDGTQVATGSEDGTVKIWQAANGNEIRTITISSAGVYAVAFSPNGRLLAVGGTDGGLGIWRVANGNKVTTLQGHSRAVYTVAFNHNGQRLVSASVDNTAKVWNISGGGLVKNFGGRAFYSAAFSPDGKYIITGNDGQATIWKISNGKNVMNLKHSSGAAVRSACFGPKGKHIAMGGEDNTARIWEIQLPD